MSTMKSKLVLSGAFGGMTANERRLGRFIRDGEGHPAPAAPAAAPQTEAPAPAEPAPPAQVQPDTDDFAAFEAQIKDNEFSGPDEPATSETGEDGTGEPPAPEPEGASVQERIDQLTAARREAERREAEALRELEALRAAAPPPAPKPEVTNTPEDQAPDPEAYEFGEADARFIADTARFHARQEFQEQTRQAEIRSQIAEVETKWAGAVAQPDVVAQYPDFAQKVTEGAQKGLWDCTAHMAIVIKSSEVGPHLAYELATNPAESKRIAGLSPFEQALEIGRLEGRISAERKQTPATPPKVVSDAPTPPQRSRGAGGKFSVDADTDDFAAFEAFADAKLKK